MNGSVVPAAPRAPYPGLLPFSVKTYPVVQLAGYVGPRAPGAWPPPMPAPVAIWRSSLDTGTNATHATNIVYLHVPFCPFLCAYCPLYKVDSIGDRQGSVKAQFVNRLIDEIELYGRTPAVRATHFGAVYFGGGTPSELAPDQLLRILDTLRRNLDIDPAAEITLEGVARQMTEAYLGALYDGGFNRLSFGVQSLDPVVRKRIGRGDDVRDYHGVVETSRGLRPHLPVNVDMMSGLSEQSVDSLAHDVEEVSRWDLNSVDVLFYVAMPGTKLHKLIKLGKRRAPDYGPVLMQMRRATNALFADRGFTQLTGEVFTRDDEDLFVKGSFGAGAPHRLNTVLALGPSGFGLLEGTVYQNVADLRRYMDQVGGGHFPVSTAATMGVAEAKRRARLLSVLQLHLPAQLVDDWRTRRLVAGWRTKGLVDEDDGGYTLTELGTLWYNHMQLDLLTMPDKIALLRMVGDLGEIGSILRRSDDELNSYETELRDTLLTRGPSRPFRRALFRAYFGVRGLPGFDNRAIRFTGRGS